VNSNLILFADRQASGPLVIAPQTPQLMSALLRIAAVRANERDTISVMEGAFDESSLVSRYCLNRLILKKPEAVPAGYIARLEALRDQERRDTHVRMLANELALALRGAGDSSDEEYTWLRQSFTRSSSRDWNEVRLFAVRMIEFPAKRAESAALFMQVVVDQQSPQARRIAAYSTFEDPRLFRFADPDPVSEKILRVCARILNDPDPVLRGAGAALLHNLSVRIEGVNKAAYVEQAEVAVAAARAAENDPMVRGQFDHFLRLLSNSVRKK
jgi:hypothetical protein